MSERALAATEGPRFLRAVAWLACLGPFFYLSYGFANWLASGRAEVPAVVFGWERSIPFLAWTIIPYWTINFFYALSLFTCRSREELDQLGKRLLTVQVVAVTCFILFPLTFTFERPESDGFSGFLFAVLAGFDKPFNQAPSLHIALLVVLWDHYARLLPRRWRLVLHVWALLVGVSVLTTYQHHFIDMPTGALLGLMVLWMWRTPAKALAGWRFGPGRERRLNIAALYGFGSFACVVVAAVAGGCALWLLWPAVSLILVASAYAVVGPFAFGKRDDGRMEAASLILLAPYLIGAWVNSRIWTRKLPRQVVVMDGVFLGRLPGRDDTIHGVVDLCAELPMPRGATAYAFVPALDLVAPSAETLRTAARAIESQRAQGPVLVCCALGFSRSVAAVAVWLLMTGRARTPDEAIAILRAARGRIVISDALRALIVEAAA
ncbi:ser/threonine protein phosphatase [Azorhizobium oxalatiphilum]|uniref:Ser/threonine protein phosphatase n=1 Tax=Azorhizobium oxalatiphilum TaxID=980631 RepID=A0A917F964_9HYPH|nr:phosphatase PAP2/dual specificity phosphatase family protein [Azorhizobium oxalatiphilum]GGF59084.1 ser/threonine protein phosphatase [Azorhizobium oxalatiphilum]